MISNYTEIQNKSVDEKLNIVEAISSLNNFSDDDFVVLEYLSLDEDSEVRAKVAEILVFSESSKAEKILIKLLMDKDELVRVNACDSLCTSNSIEVLNLLKNVVSKDKSNLVKGYASMSIADIASSIDISKSEFVDFFKQLIKKEKSGWVKIHFYKALYLLGDNSSLEMILNGLNSNSYRNRCAVVNILDELVSSENVEVIEEKLIKKLKVEKATSVKSSVENVLHRIETAIKNA